jgi:hypothetical protein
MSGKTGTAVGTTTLTLPGGRSIALADWIDDRHWTTIELANADNDTLEAFVQGRSQPIVGGTRNMTLVDTNIESTGSMGHAKAHEFMVYSIAIEYVRATRVAGAAVNPALANYSDPLTFRTFFELSRRLFIRYMYNTKKFSEGLVVDYPQGHGPNVFSTNANIEAVTNGRPSPRDAIAMVLPIHEQELLNYHCEVTPVIALAIAQAAADGGAALPFVDMRIIKRGLIKRSVR